MKVVAIRPRRRNRRLKARAALYTVVFSPGELRRHDSSFDGFCRNDCEYSIGQKRCGEQCCEGGEYGRLMYLWRQNGYLIRYFKNNIKYLQTDRYGHLEIVQAIQRHKQLVVAIDDFLQHGDLGTLFIPLYKSPDGKVYHPESKFKSHLYTEFFENWIRIYAVKYDDDESGEENYIITGGGIKLVGKMSDSAVIEYEEAKQNVVIQYLIDNGVTTREKIELLII